MVDPWGTLLSDYFCIFKISIEKIITDEKTNYILTTYIRYLVLINTLSLFIGTANSTVGYLQISKYANSSIGFKVSSEGLFYTD